MPCWRGTIAMALCLSFRLSVASRSSIKTAEQSGQFWHSGFLPLLQCVVKTFGYLQKFWHQYFSSAVVVDKFCYLGDMLSVDGDADAAVEARIRIGWNKFR